jgi:hypothetical protein
MSLIVLFHVVDVTLSAAPIPENGEAHRPEGDREEAHR